MWKASVTRLRGAAKGGREAIELYKELKPGLVTMYILMDAMDGLQALEGIMLHDSAAKVVMVTSQWHDEKQQNAQKLGALGYIRKPFKQSEVLKEIDRVLKL